MLCDNNENQITKENLVKLMLNFIGDNISLSEAEILNQNLKIAERFLKKYLEYNLNKFKKNISKMSKEIGMERTALIQKIKIIKY